MLVECSAFDIQRTTLKNVIGKNLSIKTLIGALLADENKREAVSIFCKEVLQLKEKREREDEISDSLRRDRKLRRLNMSQILK